MTTTIKFRGFRTDGKGWVEGYYVYRPDGKHLIYWQPFPESTNNTYHEIHPESLGQFTGQTDKNGREIFGAIGEKGGDVVISNSRSQLSCRIPTKVIIGIPYYVKFHEGAFKITKASKGKRHHLTGLLVRAFNIEIIGNQLEQDNGN